MANYFRGEEKKRCLSVPENSVELSALHKEALGNVLRPSV